MNQPRDRDVPETGDRRTGRAAEVDPQFPDRWSPRSLRGSINRDQVESLLEAARWAPSAFNEQPWLFCWALEEEPRKRFCECLTPKNRLWACRAPLLLFVAARKGFARHGKPNRHASFDAGAAWMSLALQARRMGLFAHAMAGFDMEAAHAATGLRADEYEIMAAIAVGKRGAAEELHEDFRDTEKPNSRKAASGVGIEAR